MKKILTSLAYSGFLISVREQAEGHTISPWRNITDPEPRKMMYFVKNGKRISSFEGGWGGGGGG